MQLPITADVLVPVGVGVLVAILTIVVLSLALRRPVADDLPPILSDWTGEMAMPSLVGRPGAAGPVTVAEAMAVRQADTAPLRVVSPATAVLPHRAPYARPAAEFEQQPMVPAARRAQDDRMPYVPVSELDGSPDWLVPTVGPAEQRFPEPRTTSGAATTSMPVAPSPMQPSPTQPSPVQSAPAVAVAASAGTATAAGVTASITSALIAGVAARAAAAGGAAPTTGPATGVPAAAAAPAAPTVPATDPPAPATPWALPAYLTASRPAPATITPSGRGPGPSVAAGVPSAGPAAAAPTRVTPDVAAVSPTATTVPLDAVEPGRSDEGAFGAGAPSAEPVSAPIPVPAVEAAFAVPAAALGDQHAATDTPAAAPAAATAPQVAPVAEEEQQTAVAPVQETSAQELPATDVEPAGSASGAAEDLADLPDLPRRDPSRGRDAPVTAGSGRPVAAAVAQALAVRAAAAGPTGTPRGDARDRLLAVLLADPVRAVGAATDLATCQDQLTRFRAAVEDSRLRLGEAVGRLAGSGLTHEQLIRLTGLSDEEIRTLLAGSQA